MLKMLIWDLKSVFPQPGLPDGVLTFSDKECLRVPRPSGSPNAGQAVPPAPGVQFLQVDIQTKVRKIQELLEKSDFGKSLGAIHHVFLQRILMRV